MSKRKKIKKKDIFIKARMISEGVCIQALPERFSSDLRELSETERKGELNEIEVPKKLDFSDIDNIMKLAFNNSIYSSANSLLGTTLILEESGLLAPIYPNKHSRLDFSMEGETVTISDGGDVLATGKLPKKPEWMNAKLSNGLPITAALPGVSASIINVVFTLACMNYNSNRGCRYCNLFANPVSRHPDMLMLPKKALSEWAKYQAEAVQIATEHRWHGNIALSGGALPPRLRGEYLERIEIVLSMLREYVGEETLKSQTNIVYNHYPPEDLSDMWKWKEMGIQATSIDLEVMDPAYFAAICPGKNAYKPHAYWKKAQEKSVEVFGPIFGTTGCIVMGIEPMETLVKGMDERLSKGIMPIPLVFFSAPGAAYWGFRAPTAEWIVEASEKIVDSFLKYAPKYLPTALAQRGRRSGRKTGSRSRQSTHLTVVFDELARRMGGSF
ncbi:MAG: hypothetical protein HWN65_23450 [Candidatus Helarchaeota archaeon]|nr:hypothetical protein [Candidatus Helarchaeota archaeon]